jgi:phage terminase large subunit GpA-like protein
MTSEAITRVFSEAIASAIPESSLTVSEWAATYRYVSAERSARPGKWRNELVPYLVDIMDAVSKPGVREVIFVKSAQVAGSECLNNVIGYYMHIDPSPIQYVCEIESKARAWSTESLAPMIRDTPVLANLIEEPRSRDSGNTIEEKSFPGGHLAIGWATSGSTLSSRPRRVMLLDERDAFKPTSEGDPAKMAEARTKTFPDSVIFKVSTPRDRMENPPGSPPDAPRYSPIELEYENSDKQKCYLPCPHCGEYQVLVWSRVKWDEGKAGEAYYVCVNGCLIEHEHKQEMLAKREWRAEKPFTGRMGFHIWEGYSPFVTWGEMALNFLESKKSRAALKVFINTSLAEGWEETTEQASTDDLIDRCEEFAVAVPRGVLVLTAGVDVQGNRLEVEIVGWGLDEESWSIGYHVLEGDPAQSDVWEDLKELLARDYEFEVPVGGESDEDAAQIVTTRVRATCIDSGGHHTKQVYRFCHENKGRRVYAVKGANTPGKPLISKFTLQGKPAVRLYTVGTETAKDTIAAHLLIPKPGPGYCHFPHKRDENYFKQLRSERPVTRYERGKAYRRWEKIKASARNEALDLRVYAMAACAILNPKFRSIARRTRAAAVELLTEPPAAAPEAVEEVQTSVPEDQSPEEQVEPKAPRRRPPRRGQKNFATSWR